MATITKCLGVLACCFSFFTAASAAVTPSGGNYFYLATNGDDANDGKTINAPVKTFWRAQYLLSPGDVLLVRGGTYADQLFVTVTDGTADKPITVQAYPGEKPIIGGHSGYGAFIIAEKPYYVFDGLSYEGMFDGNYVFWIHDTHHITLRNISIKNFANDMVLLHSCADVVIENSYFDTTGNPAESGFGEHIWVAGSSRVLIQNNTLIRAGHASISLIDDNRNGNRSVNNVIRNNRIEQHWGGGIYVGNYSRANLVDNNQISFAGENVPYPKLGIGLSCPDNIIRRNVISRTGSSRQALDNGMGIYAWDDGGKIQNAIDNRIYNNVIYRSANRGLYFFLRGTSEATRNKFVNNVIYHNKEQFCDDYGCAKGLEISVDSYHTLNKWPSYPNENFFFNNVILSAIDGVDQPDGTSVSYDYEGWTKSVTQLQTDYPKYFKGNTTANPKFVDADNGSFLLQGSSPLIDGGADLTRTVSAGTNTTQVRVEDARFFTDGYSVVPGDVIKIGTNDPVSITAVDLTSNTLTVARGVTFKAGDVVNLPFAGAKPDIGAFEYGQSSLIPFAGTPQDAVVETRFGSPLQARLLDAASNPVAGVTVTFTAPASGAGITFGGATTAAAVTSESGIATSPIPVANRVAGDYQVVASAPGYSIITFSLRNTTAATDEGVTIFGNAALSEQFYSDGKSVELGVKFRSDKKGYVKGVRFFKSPIEREPHTGSLWTTSGTLLATGAFTNETPSGWQHLTFSSPVAIAANTTYIASYHSNSGFFVRTRYYDAISVDNPPLHALKSGVDGPNGLYAFGAATVFPADTYMNSNYWADVIFVPEDSAQDLDPKEIVALSGSPQSTPVGSSFALPLKAKVTGDGAKPIANATVTFTAAAAGASASFGGSRTATAVTNEAGIATSPIPLANATVGVHTVTASISNLPPAAFTLTNTQPGCMDRTVFTSTDAPVDYYSAGPVELGMRFRSDLGGIVKGIRFYKAAGDTSVRTGSLWSKTGELLATGTFTSESPSGWQLLTFASPVKIAANTTYLASYHTNGGFYYTLEALKEDGIDRGPLHVLKDGVEGGNGLYLYGPGGQAPTDYWASSNYWVDVVFNDCSMPVATEISVVSGGGQTAPKGAAFAQPLKAKVLQNGAPLAGATVTFTAPASGASASLGGSAVKTAVTDSAGIATSVIPIANQTEGAYIVKATVTGTSQAASFTLTNNAGACGTADKSVFTTTEKPTLIDNGSFELGVRFRADSRGMIRGIKFYKASGDTSAHTGSLWTDSGQLLATGTFSGETASGWQTLVFTAPVAINANTRYVASYHVNGPFYYTSQAFPLTRPPLNVVEGLISAGAGGAMPATSKTTNYWVDVLFNAGANTIAAFSGTPQTGEVCTQFALPLKARVTDACSNPVANVTVTFMAQSSAATAKLNGSGSASAITDVGGVATSPIPVATCTAGAYTVSATAAGISTPVSFSLTNSANAPKTIFGANENPTEIYENGPVELGVRFRADVDGSIRGVRFYKIKGDTSAHTGSLWSKTGQLLATGTFANETASGWQTLTFANPVAITANTTYVASYHTNGAFYYEWDRFKDVGIDNPPLHALKDGADGGNGLYLYGPGGAMPTAFWAHGNYWVDVVFVSR